MSRRLDRPAAACTLVVSLTALWAAALPGTARADDGLEEPLASVTTLTEAASSATEVALATAAAPDVTAATAPTAPAEPVTPDEQVGTTGETANAALLPPPASSEEPVVVTEPTVSPAPPAPAPAEAPKADTTPDTVDITGDTPPADPDPAPTTPEAQNTAPEPQEKDGAPVPTPSTSPVPSSTNVNVSVRINSPGDNGPVTQLNVTATVPPPASPGPTPAPQSTKPAAPPAPEHANAAPDAAGSSDTWYWSWNCLDVAPFSPISPGGSGAVSVPSSWTWIWNCAGNDAQYQGETQIGFRQENTNISIRFASPGNDGPVSQVNVAVSVPVAAGARVTQQGSASSSSSGTPTVVSPAPIVPGLGDTPGFPAVISPSDGADIALPTPLATATADVALPVIGTAASPEAAGPSPLLGVAPRVAFGAGPRIPWAGGTSANRPGVDATTGWTPAHTTLLEGARPASTPVSNDGAVRRASGPPAAKAAPSSRKSGTDRSPLRDPVSPTPLSGASAAPVSSGGSSGSGLPFLLALPFVAAMLDLARRVAFERATWPSGHRRRVPDEPG